MRLIDADRLKSYIDCGHLRPPTEVCFSELDVCNMIDKAPTVSAEAVQRWIPVSERLPEYTVDMWDKGVIATVEGREGNIIYKHGVVPNAWFEEGEWYVDDVKLEHAKVTAWMPLPEPYREDGDGGGCR